MSPLKIHEHITSEKALFGCWPCEYAKVHSMWVKAQATIGDLERRLEEAREEIERLKKRNLTWSGKTSMERDSGENE